MHARRHIVPHLAALALGLLAWQASAGTLTFIHVNDLHAHLTPHLDLVRDGDTTRPAMRGGLARLATLIKRIRAENPDSVVMNIGDTFHGGVEALFTNGNAIVDPVNALGIDIGVPGNWDFAYGPDVTRLRYVELTAMERRLLSLRAGGIKRPAYANLAANVTFTMPAGKAGQTILPPTQMRTVGGVKVGFIGLTSDIVPEMHASLAMGMSFLEGESDYRDLIDRHAAALRAAGARLVVVMSELGLHKDYRLADVVAPGAVDVFFSAHTHEAVFTPLKGRSGAIVMEAGNDGWLGRLDVVVTDGQAPRFTWRLLPVDETLAEDPAMKALVDAARAPFLAADPNLVAPMGGLALHHPITGVVGHAHAPMDRRDALQSSFNNAWTDALKTYAGSDLALSPGFRFDAVVPESGFAYEDGHVADGEVTWEDVYRYFPVPYTLATGVVSGARLKEILESNLSGVFSLDNFAQHGGWVDGYAGLSARLDLARPDGERVLALARSANAAGIGADDLVSVAGCRRPMDAADVLCGYGGFQDVAPLINPATGGAWYVQDLFVHALENGLLGDGTRADLVDAAATPLWPSQPYVQPLPVEATSQARITTRNLRYDRVTGIHTIVLQVHNTGDTALGLPLKLVVEGLPAGTTLANASGSYHGAPYLALPAALPARSSTTLVLKLKSPRPAPPRFRTALYTGGV
ncbi:MAG: bifunctional metallophosphatase/5'-nucleotidase [Pseudomonadota bacterium]